MLGQRAGDGIGAKRGNLQREPSRDPGRGREFGHLVPRAQEAGHRCIGDDSRSPQHDAALERLECQFAVMGGR